eukprot:745605-Hanusia_phi.AAC.1
MQKQANRKPCEATGLVSKLLAMFGGSKKGLEDELFNLKFVSKQLQRESKKAEKEMIKEKEKVKKALEQGKHDIAEIHAQNAIMQKNQTLNYLRMSSRIVYIPLTLYKTTNFIVQDAVAGKLGAAMKMQKVTSSMAQITKSMGKVLQTMKLDKIEAIMDKFEKVCKLSAQLKVAADTVPKVFEDADVMSAQVTGAMQSRLDFFPVGKGKGAGRLSLMGSCSTSMSTPQSEIEELLQQVADENQLDLGENMPQAVNHTDLPKASGIDSVLQSKNVAKAGEQVQEEDELMRSSTMRRTGE